MAIRNYLGVENFRNVQSRDAFVAACRIAYGCRVVVVGHHLSPVVDEENNLIEEIPSADTLHFDHDIAKAVYGKDWKKHLRRLAVLAPCERDEYLAAYLDKHHGIACQKRS